MMRLCGRHRTSRYDTVDYGRDRYQKYGHSGDPDNRQLVSHPGFQIALAHRPQSSSASRFTAGASGFSNLSQSFVRPER
jgi:hypothetical protein